LQDLNHYTSGWTDWNLALNLEGGPNWVNNLVDAPIIVNKTSLEYYKQPFFYALGHFSKFLIPDSVRIQVTANDELGSFETTAFVRPDNATVVIALNMNAEAVELTIDDTVEGKIKHIIKAHSMQSYIWYN
jgi:glucosylceramidase